MFIQLLLSIPHGERFSRKIFHVACMYLLPSSSSYVMYFSCYVYTLDTHVTHACPEFKSKSIEEVYNTSKSKFSSRVCNKRQHTLLHQTLDRPAGVTAVASDLSNSYVILSRYKSIFSSAILMSMLFYHGYF